MQLVVFSSQGDAGGEDGRDGGDEGDEEALPTGAGAGTREAFVTVLSTGKVTLSWTPATVTLAVGCTRCGERALAENAHRNRSPFSTCTSRPYPRRRASNQALLHHGSLRSSGYSAAYLSSVVHTSQSPEGGYLPNPRPGQLELCKCACQETWTRLQEL